MTAPTEAEIRAAIDAKFADNGTLNSSGILSDAFCVACSVLDDLYDTNDLRPSEQATLDEAGYSVMRPIRERAAAELQEALVAAALRFAAEFPDAPRAVREPVPA